MIENTLAAMKPNKLLKIVNKINSWPVSLRSPALTLAFNSNIKYAGTTGIVIRKWNTEESVVTCKNRWRVQNHLGGIHATAMATLAESATGMLFGLYVPDSHIPLLKSMKVSFHKRAVGDLTAVASITEEQKKMISCTDQGSTLMEVRVTDEEGKEPIQCEMEWAWTSKQRKPKETEKRSKL